MNTEINNLKRYIPVTALVVGKVANDGTATISSVSGPEPIDRSQVSVARDGAGDVTLTIKNFKGPRGLAYGFGNAKTAEIMINPQDGTYTGNTLEMQFLCEDDAGSAADTDFNFMIWAF